MKDTAKPSSEKLMTIPVSLLFPSPFNPRKTYDEAGLRELALTLKSQGQLQPILVRPVNGTYEVLDGFRRLLAAPSADLKALQAQVREGMSDDDARAVVLILNLQREALPPLEEAQAIAFLLTQARDIPFADRTRIVAEQIGKSPSYVAKRAKLVDLTPSWKEALLERRITIGHALAVAPFPAGMQERAADHFLYETRYGAGDKEKRGKPYGPDAIGTIHRLQQTLAHLALDLGSAPFDTDSSVLVPKAGSCVSCPKRAGNEPTLFGELPSGTCTDPACYQGKVDAHIAAFQAGHPGVPLLQDHYGPAPKGMINREKFADASKGKCESVTEAILGTGPQRGRVLKVCLDRECKVHWTRGTPGRSSGGEGRIQRSKAELAAEQKKRQQQEEERAIRIEAIRAIAKAVSEAPAGDQIGYLVDALGEHSHFDAHRIVCHLLALDPGKKEGGVRDYRGTLQAHIEKLTSARQIAEVGVLLDLAEKVGGEYGDAPRSLKALAKRVGVDLKASEKRAKALLAEKAKAKALKRHGKKEQKAKGTKKPRKAGK